MVSDHLSVMVSYDLYTSSIYKIVPCYGVKSPYIYKSMFVMVSNHLFTPYLYKTGVKSPFYICIYKAVWNHLYAAYIYTSVSWYGVKSPYIYKGLSHLAR